VSFAIDVNILVYASDRASPFHQRAVEFIEDCVSGNVVFYLTWVTVMSYMRIATHPRIFEQPLPAEEAAHNIEALLGAPHARVLSEEEGFWRIYRETMREIPTRGNLVPDAHLAVILRQHGVRVLYTRDRDFLKFRFLDVRDPFAATKG
jgi:uncharacterized protein